VRNAYEHVWNAANPSASSLPWRQRWRSRRRLTHRPCVARRSRHRQRHRLRHRPLHRSLRPRHRHLLGHRRARRVRSRRTRRAADARRPFVLTALPQSHQLARLDPGRDPGVGRARERCRHVPRRDRWHCRLAVVRILAEAQRPAARTTAPARAACISCLVAACSLAPSGRPDRSNRGGWECGSSGGCR
jgi:hypothetical protein